MENKKMFSLLDSFGIQIAEGRVAFLLQRADSHCWELKQMKKMLATIDVEVCTFSSGAGNSEIVWKLVHNSSPLICNLWISVKRGGGFGVL